MKMESMSIAELEYSLIVIDAEIEEMKTDYATMLQQRYHLRQELGFRCLLDGIFGDA